MSNQDDPFKNLTLETKALIIVSEFEAERMPASQLRRVLQGIANGPDDIQAIAALVDGDLRAGGHPVEKIENFLAELTQPMGDDQRRMTTTRRLRSPFARGFDSPPRGVPAAGQEPQPVVAPPSATPPPLPVQPQAPVKPLAPSKAFPSPGGPPRPKGRTELFRTTSPPMGQPPRPPSAPNLPPPAPPQAAPRPMRPPTPAMNRPVPPGMGGRATRVVSKGGTMFVGPRPTPQRMAGRDRETVQFGASKGGLRPGAAAPNLSAILVADDDKRVRMVQKIRLEDAGYKVVEAGDGTEAWRILSTGEITLAVLDMKMPGLHGLEVLSRIADAGLNLPVIICSAYDQLKDEFIVATYPRLKYLVKPVSPDTLLQAVKELIGTPAG